jgi:hypothetical protein
MLEANINEAFPITVSLLDDSLAELVLDQVVSYDVRTIDDLPLTPPINGTLDESTVERGIYKKELSIPIPGSFICYATCSGFVSSTEEIVVNAVNPIDVSKYNLPYNISVIDVTRTTVSGGVTASQLARNVPLGKTDYIVTLIKGDADLDWTNPVSSGTSYAHYTATSSDLPFMMGGPY